MRNVNKVILLGNVSRDPVKKTTQNGQTLTMFGLATHRYFKTQDGETKSVTEFHNIVAWGELGNRCYEDVKKGKLMYIEGYLKTRAFDVAEDKKSFRTEIVMYNMIILSKQDFTDDGSYQDNENKIHDTDLDNNDIDVELDTSKKDIKTDNDNLSDIDV